MLAGKRQPPESMGEEEAWRVMGEEASVEDKEAWEQQDEREPRARWTRAKGGWF